MYVNEYGYFTFFPDWAFWNGCEPEYIINHPEILGIETDRLCVQLENIPSHINDDGLVYENEEFAFYQKLYDGETINLHLFKNIRIISQQYHHLPSVFATKVKVKVGVNSKN